MVPKIISSFWGIVFYIRDTISLGSTTKKTLLNWDLLSYGLFQTRIYGDDKGTMGVLTEDAGGKEAVEGVPFCL